MRIRIFVYDGADELDFIGPWEVLQRAASLHPNVEVALVTAEGSEAVTAQHGLRLIPQGRFDGSADLVLLPGGGYVGNAEFGVRREIARGVLGGIARALHQQGAVVAGVCTGTMILAAAGLLDGRSATTHHSAMDDLRRTSALVRSNRIVDDGDILTCGGVTSGLDLAFWMVERFFGAPMAEQIAKFMEYTPNRDVYCAQQIAAQSRPEVPG